MRPYINTNWQLFRMIFRWVFIPWLQRELDAYQDRVNNTRKRRDRNKILPHGAPDIIYQSPENFGVLDFKVSDIQVLLILQRVLVLTFFFSRSKLNVKR